MSSCWRLKEADGKRCLLYETNNERWETECGHVYMVSESGSKKRSWDPTPQAKETTNHQDKMYQRKNGHYHCATSTWKAFFFLSNVNFPHTGDTDIHIDMMFRCVENHTRDTLTSQVETSTLSWEIVGNRIVSTLQDALMVKRATEEFE